jgi:hypothetical protein
MRSRTRASAARIRCDEGSVDAAGNARATTMNVVVDDSGPTLQIAPWREERQTVRQGGVSRRSVR